MVPTAKAIAPGLDHRSLKGPWRLPAEMQIPIEIRLYDWGKGPTSWKSRLFKIEV